MTVVPRIYALDVVIPAASSGWPEPVVVDLNGSRSGLAAAQIKIGDSRVEIEVLSTLAEAGGGRLLSPVLRRVPNIRDTFSLDAMLSENSSSVGIGRGREAYAPRGRSFALNAEVRVSRLARSIGIDYRTILFDWNPDERDFLSDEERSQRLREWNSYGGAVWPYSWDWRAIAFPASTSLVNPFAIQLLTTNKLFLSAAHQSVMINSSDLIPTGAFGFCLDGTRLANWRASIDGDKDRLWIIKPAQGRRGIGVVACDEFGLAAYATMAGLESNQALLEQGVRMLAAASLTGDLPEAFTLLQPYILPSVRRHPYTGQLHGSVQRATVLSDHKGIRCLDVTTVLFQEPRENLDGKGARQRLLMTPQEQAVCLEPRVDEFDAVSSLATRFVQAIERYANSMPDRPLDAIRDEAAVTASFADRTFDVSCLPAISEAWKKGKSLLEILNFS